ncbi:hypothetical protein ACJMK2_041786 [Sinanodonta woodiana]|uniref:DNA 3'-5' helicase n=1 Tax=Sinanodonta woodiana TaxID=1069815 RepID=A0ABD3W592_SINWO
MFHISTHQLSKERILDNFRWKDGSIRCIVATVALGMEMDMREVDLVIHFGCPKSVLVYWQKRRRCARDDIATIVTNVEKKCIRKQILQHLSIEHVDANEPVPVCKGCEDVLCQCSLCKCCCVCIDCPCFECTNFTVRNFLSCKLVFYVTGYEDSEYVFN